MWGKILARCEFRCIRFETRQDRGGGSDPSFTVERTLASGMGKGSYHSALHV